MNPLAEPQAVASLLNHPDGWVHVFSDGSSRWAATPADPKQYWDPQDVPESIACPGRNYHVARIAFSTALKRLRARGVLVG